MFMDDVVQCKAFCHTSACCGGHNAMLAVRSLSCAVEVHLIQPFNMLCVCVKCVAIANAGIHSQLCC